MNYVISMQHVRNYRVYQELLSTIKKEQSEGHIETQTKRTNLQREAEREGGMDAEVGFDVCTQYTVDSMRKSDP